MESGQWRNQNKLFKGQTQWDQLTASISLYTSFQLPGFPYVYYDRVMRKVALVNHEYNAYLLV